MAHTIFIVEDEPSLQFFYKEVLTHYGYQIIGLANNGEEAVNMYKTLSKKPDIILMDHRLPLKTGMEATKEIMKLNNTPHIIFVSADETIKDEALNAGVCSFIHKPFNIDDLIENIEIVLNKS